MRDIVEYEDGIAIKAWRSGKDSLDDVLYLINESHKSAVSAEWLENKLSWGRGGIAAIAYDDTLPVGIALLGSAPYVEFGRPVDVLLSLSNFVASGYRGRGIYRRLLENINDICQVEGFEVALTFPNHNSRPGFSQAGWKALHPMQAYIRVPLSWNPKKMVLRLRKLLKSHSQDFTPIKGRGLGPTDFASLSCRIENDDTLKFLPSEKALVFRFNKLRGPGYHAIHGKHASAVVSVGNRGRATEVQFLVTFPRQLRHVEWRQLSRIIKKTFDPDLISRIESKRARNILNVFDSGFIRLRPVTIPYWISFKDRSMSAAPILSGIDLHRW